MTNNRKFIIIIIFVITGFSSLYSQSQTTNAFTNNENIAIKGYDVVSYFKNYKAVRGSKANSIVYDGVTYYFISKENQTNFKKDPKMYLPQYGGWCAFGMAAQNTKVPSDPKTFKIYNGKLYLFFNDYYKGTHINTIIPWNSNEAKLKIKADKNWEKMTTK